MGHQITLSRVANSMYWIGRYTERSESLIRLLDAQLNLSMNIPSNSNYYWESILNATGKSHAFKQRRRTLSSQSVLAYLLIDPHNEDSLLSTIHHTRENARAIRERISADMWIDFNHLYLYIKDYAQNPELDSPSLLDFFDTLKIRLRALHGSWQQTMSHNKEWYFLQLGLYIERIDQVSRILSAFYGSITQDKEPSYGLFKWRAVLDALSATEMYQQHYGVMSIQSIVSFILLDNELPRSIRFAINQAQLSLLQITGNSPHSFQSTLEKTMGRLKANFDFIEIKEILQFGLHEYLQKTQERIADIHQLTYQQFFDTSKESVFHYSN